MQEHYSFPVLGKIQAVNPADMKLWHHRENRRKSTNKQTNQTAQLLCVAQNPGPSVSSSVLSVCFEAHINETWIQILYLPYADML